MVTELLHCGSKAFRGTSSNLFRKSLLIKIAVPVSCAFLVLKKHGSVHFITTVTVELHILRKTSLCFSRQRFLTSWIQSSFLL